MSISNEVFMTFAPRLFSGSGEYRTTVEPLRKSDDANSNAEARLQRLAWLLDSSIPLPGGLSIGLDGLIGLVPGVGDAAGAIMSSYLIYEARRMNAPQSLLLRMVGNVLIETVIGAISLLGDVFDFAFKANQRNVRLLANYNRDPRRSVTEGRWAVGGFAVRMIVALGAAVAVPIAVIIALAKVAWPLIAPYYVRWLVSRVVVGSGLEVVHGTLPASGQTSV